MGSIMEPRSLDENNSIHLVTNERPNPNLGKPKEKGYDWTIKMRPMQ